MYSKQTVTLDPHRDHVTFSPFIAPERMSVLEIAPERVAITTRDGRIVEERFDPRASFPSAFVDISRPWEAIQVAYFTSSAIWNYLTEPFVFTQPGVQTREIAPWTEDTQIWRRLAVTFPKTITNHNADQVFYFDDTFMQRRMDYSPDVPGKPPVAHYTYDHKYSMGSCFRRDGSYTFTTQTASQTNDSHRLRLTWSALRWRIASMCCLSLDEIEYAERRRFRRGPSKRRVYAAPARLRLNHRALGRLDDEEGGGRAEQGKRMDRVRLHARDLHLVMRPVAQGASVRFAYSSMDSRRALLTELTLTTKATARLPNRGCTS